MAHMMQTYHPLPVIFERGEGAYLFDAGGRRYLDFAAGIATSALGHGHPKLRQALFEQGAKLWHLSNFFTIPGQEQLAARLCSVSFAERAFFTNSGRFFSNGKTPTLIGAIRGWNFMTTRVSALPLSSVTVSSWYAWQIRANTSRSTPALGSITCGTYRDLASSSK